MNQQFEYGNIIEDATIGPYRIAAFHPLSRDICIPGSPFLPNEDEVMFFVWIHGEPLGIYFRLEDAFAGCIRGKRNAKCNDN